MLAPLRFAAQTIMNGRRSLSGCVSAPVSTALPPSHRRWKLRARDLPGESGLSEQAQRSRCKAHYFPSIHRCPDFLARIQRELDGNAADWSRNGVGYLVYRFPSLHSDDEIFRDFNVFRENSAEKAQEIYASHRHDFTASEDWKLYLEKGDGTEKWFISYKGTHFDTNHGIPMWVNAKPEIFVGILKQNVFIVISYTSYSSSSGHVQSINKDVRYVADLLAKATR